MRPIYSHQLAAGAVAASSNIDVYTAPALEGPTIVKGASLLAEAGGEIGLYLDGSGGPNLCVLNNLAGAAPVTEFFELWQVLEPGQKLAVFTANAVRCTWLVSGQHFASP